ncbi:MAG: CehA/McbA family metallohydrolase [bacterium]|jgi:hypothetical protein|nr:CehA/McbA family metallohydrolase [bacterium]
MSKKISIVLVFMLLLISMSMAYGDNLSPIGYWSFDESKDGICPDNSPNKNNGKIYGASQVEGIKGSALGCNGIDNYLEITHSDDLNPTGAFSISLFAKLEPVEEGYAGRTILGKPGTGYLGSYSIFSNKDGTGVIFMMAAGKQCFQISGSVSPYAWHHLALVYDGSELYGYINGKNIGKKSISGSIDLNINKDPLRIGGGVKERSFRGAIDEVKIYNRKLSEEEIKDESSSVNMVKKAPSAKELIAYFPLDEGKGNIAHDQSSMRANGTVINGLWSKADGDACGLEFDGKRTRVDIPHQDYLNFDDRMSLAAWVNLADPLGANGVISKGRATYSGYNFSVINKQLVLELYVEDKGKRTPCRITSAPLIERGKWYHVGFSFDGKQGKTMLYLNGKCVKEANTSGRICYSPPLGDYNYAALPLVISGLAPFPDIHYQFSGFIREVKLYNYALSPTEINRDYESNTAIAKLKLLTEHAKYLQGCTSGLKCSVTDADTGKAINVKAMLHNDSGIHFFPEDIFSYGHEKRGQFYAFGNFEMKLPPGKYNIVLLRGFEYEPQKIELTLGDGEEKRLDIKLKRWVNLPNMGWYGGDEELQTIGHTEKRYDMLLTGDNIGNAFKIFQAEGLNWFHIVSGMDGESHKLLDNETLAGSGQEVGSRVLGDVICLNADTGKAGYFAQLDALSALQASGGAATFAEEIQYPIEKAVFVESCRGLPVAVALGKVNLWRYAFKGEKPIGYRFLNAGFRMAATAATDCYINNPATIIAPGYYRAYTKLKELSWQEITDAYKAQRLFVSDGPFVIFKANGRDMGSVITLPEAGGSVRCEIEAGHLYGVEKIEVIMDGRVVKTITPDSKERIFRTSYTQQVNTTGWLAVRCYGRRGEFFGNWAHTAPVYIQVGKKSIKPSEDDIEYFLSWISNLRKAITGLARKEKWAESIYSPYLKYVDEAERIYQGLKANPRKW